MTIVLAALLIATAIFFFFTVWWLREFTVPPLVDIQNHPSVRRPITRTDLEHPPAAVWAVTATSAYGPIIYRP